ERGTMTQLLSHNSWRLAPPHEKADLKPEANSHKHRLSPMECFPPRRCRQPSFHREWIREFGLRVGSGSGCVLLGHERKLRESFGGDRLRSLICLADDQGSNAIQAVDDRQAALWAKYAHHLGQAIRHNTVSGYHGDTLP